MTGFPAGSFVVLSIASSRLLDVEGRRVEEDGTEIILYPTKETSLDGRLRNPWNDNQVFFVDESGHLRAKPSQLPIDIEEDRLVLRTIESIKESNIVLAKFSYSPETKEIKVRKAPSALESEYEPGAGDKTYIMTAIPKPNPRLTFPDGTYALLPPSGAYADGDDSGDEDDNVDAKDLDALNQSELDDSLDWIRRVKVVRVLEGEQSAVPEQAKRRRQWGLFSVKDA